MPVSSFGVLGKNVFIGAPIALYMNLYLKMYCTLYDNPLFECLLSPLTLYFLLSSFSSFFSHQNRTSRGQEPVLFTFVFLVPCTEINLGWIDGYIDG